MDRREGEREDIQLFDISYRGPIALRCSCRIDTLPLSAAAQNFHSIRPPVTASVWPGCIQRQLCRNGEEANCTHLRHLLPQGIQTSLA